MNRESLVAEVNALKLNAQIAHAAKFTEILEAMQHAIDSHGLKDLLVINTLSDDILQLNTDDYYDYYSYADRFGYFSLMLHDSQKSNEQSRISLWIYDITKDRLSKSIRFYVNLDSITFTATNNHIELIDNAMHAMNDMVHALNDLLDTENFKSYENDILAYFDACKNLKKFEHEEMNRRQDEITRSLCAGMRVVSANPYDDTYFKIVKASKKRISYDGYICRCWGKLCNRSTLDREFIASQLARNKWKITSS